MDTYYIKVQGKANIPEALSIGHNFKILCDASIVSEQKIDNDNGEFDIVYKAVPVTITIEKDNGEIVKAKDPRRNSEKIRKWLYKNWSETEAEIHPFDDVYNAFTDEVMSMTPQLLRSALKRFEQ